MYLCPQCGRDAPIVYRGVIPQCTACGAVRPPLSNPSINLTGKPSRIGGIVASVFGWLVLLVGGSVAVGLALLFAAFGATLAGLAIALPVAVVSLVIGVVLVRRGGSLNRAGIEAERTTREQALLAVVAHRGSVTATEAAHALGVTLAEADAALTDLAKRDPDRVSVDVDDQGVVRYRITHIAADARVRVEAGEGWRAEGAGADEGAADEAPAASKKEAGV
jgi:hypothetical protein